MPWGPSPLFDKETIMKRFSRILTALLTTSLAGLLAAGCIVDGGDESFGDAVEDASAEGTKASQPAAPTQKLIAVEQGQALSDARGEDEAEQEDAIAAEPLSVSGGAPLDQASGMEGIDEAADSLASAAPTWCNGQQCGWCESQVLSSCTWQLKQVRYNGSLWWDSSKNTCYCKGTLSGCC
jgi:hypothetical protein